MVSDLEPDDERSVEVSIMMVRVIEPVEHVSSRSHGHVAPELRPILVVTMSRLRLVLCFLEQLFQRTMIYKAANIRSEENGLRVLLLCRICEH